MSDASIRSSQVQLKVSQLEIATQVKQVYWHYIYLRAKQKLLTYQDSIYSGYQRSAELRAKTGETNQLEMITARSHTLEIKNQLFQVTSDIGVDSRKLKVLLNTDWLPVPGEGDLQKIATAFLTDSASVSKNPSLEFIRQQVEISRIEKKLERSQM